MTDLAIILLVSWLAGLAALGGALLARLVGTAHSETRRELLHAVTAVGGGILVSAVTFALLPKGMEILHPLTLVLTFCGGGIIFCFIDYRLSRNQGSKAQLMAMLLDFVPEAISLGAVFATDKRLGVLLGLFIGAQNLPEGFNSFREITAAGRRPRSVLQAFLGISFLGPLAAFAGHFYLRDLPAVTAGIMSFAAGGILYLVFQDLAPQSRMRGHWKPMLGAVFGFAVGMLGARLLH